MSLMLHAGAHAINRDQLAALPLPNARGARHAIRPFINDVEIVADCLNEFGFEIGEEAYGVKTAAGLPTQFFGAIEVRPKALVGEVIPADEFALTIGMRGSYDQSLPRGLAVGSRVFVCDNLAFSGEVNLHTKQTTYIGQRLPAMLRDAVARVPQMAQAQVVRFDAYKNSAIKPRVGDAALIEMVRREIINPSQLGRAIQEWDQPTHPEHAAHGFSVWRLMQSVTEAIKPVNPDRAHIPAAWDRTMKLTSFLDECVGIQ